MLMGRSCNRSCIHWSTQRPHAVACEVRADACILLLTVDRNDERVTDVHDVVQEHNEVIKWVRDRDNREKKWSG